MSPIGRNITSLARKRNLSLPKLADRAGVDKGNLSRIVRTGKGYSAASLQKIADALEVTLEQLFAEEPNVTALPPGIRRVPLLDAISAGQFLDVLPHFRDAEMQDFILTNSEYSGSAFAMTVQGESMVPDFNPGDIVLVDPETPVRPGRFVVAVNGTGEAALKRYADRGTDPEGRQIFELIPSNPHYPTMRSDKQELRIIGVVRERIIKLP